MSMDIEAESSSRYFPPKITSEILDSINYFNYFADSLQTLKFFSGAKTTSTNHSQGVVATNIKSANSTNDPLAVIYSRLINLDMMGAASYAIKETKFRRLGQLILLQTMEPKGALNRETLRCFMRQQNDDWLKSGQTRLMPVQLRQIYGILAGQLEIDGQSTFPTNNWLILLLNILVYVTRDLQIAVREVSRRCMPCKDYRWSLIRLLCSSDRDDDDVSLDLFSNTPHFNWLLSRLLLTNRYALKRPNIRCISGSNEIATRIFADELESVGLIEWACVVLEDENQPEKPSQCLVQDVLCRVCTSNTQLSTLESKIIALCPHLSDRLYTAKAIRAFNDSKNKDRYFNLLFCVRNWILANKFENAFNAFVSCGLIEQCIASGNLYETLEQIIGNRDINIFKALGNYSRLTHVFVRKCSSPGEWLKCLALMESLVSTNKKESNRFVQFINDPNLKHQLRRRILDSLKSMCHLMCKWAFDWSTEDKAQNEACEEAVTRIVGVLVPQLEQLST
ncbi:hypothetical protein ACOME3_006295 [Neoechinorhynchus agilis]